MFPFREESNNQLVIGWHSERSSEVSPKSSFLCKSWQSENLGIQKNGQKEIEHEFIFPASKNQNYSRFLKNPCTARCSPLKTSQAALAWVQGWVRATSSWPLLSSSSSLSLVLLLWSPAAQGSAGGSRELRCQASSPTCPWLPCWGPCRQHQPTAGLRAWWGSETQHERGPEPSFSSPSGWNSAWSNNHKPSYHGLILSTSHSCSGSQLQHMAPTLMHFFSKKEKK